MPKTTLLRRLIIGAVIISAIAIPAWYWSRPKPVAVALKTVDRGKVEATVSNTRAGTIKACRRARLAPATGGQIARLPVRKGDRVAAGQVLLELWNEDLKAQLQQAESDNITTRANADEACVKADQAERDAERFKKLRRQGLVAEDVADKAVTNASAARLSCRAAKANIEVGAARIAVVKAALEHTILKAPFAGTIAEINGEVGEFVTPSPTGILTLPAVDLVDTSCLYISAPIDEVDAPRIRTGMEVRITLDAFANKHFQGKVKRVAPYVLELEKQARTVDVEALFTNPDEYKDLLPGYSADMEIILEARNDVLRAPTEAVLEGHRVLVYVPETGLLEERTFQPGLSNWKYTEVVSGLQAGEQAVVSIDRAGVKAGAHVEPESKPER